MLLSTIYQTSFLRTCKTPPSCSTTKTMHTQYAPRLSEIIFRMKEARDSLTSPGSQASMKSLYRVPDSVFKIVDIVLKSTVQTGIKIAVNLFCGLFHCWTKHHIRHRILSRIRRPIRPKIRCRIR